MNSYEPSRIQQEGRIFEIGEKEGSVQGQCSESSGEEDRTKDEKRKRILDSKAPYRAKKRLHVVEIGPQTLQRRANWFPCACCLAKIGCGSKVVARIIGIVTHGGVQDAMQASGIKRFVPPSGNWKQAIQHKRREERKVEYTARKDAEKPTSQEIYEDYWMREIESHSDCFEWKCTSFEWAKIIMRRSRQKRRNKIPSVKAARAAYAKRWLLLNPRDPAKARQYVKKSVAKRKLIDPGFRVQCNLRNRLKDLMQTVRNGGSDHISRLIGCTTKQLARHLESGFRRGMTWDNYGTHWHVDHVLPCSSFDHSDPKQFRQCWHWTNLSPLEAIKNISKGDKITEPQMQLLLCVTH